MKYYNFFEYVAKKSSKERGIFEIETQKFSTYEEVINNALLIGKSLYQYNQKVVSVILPNSIAYIECFLACMATNNIFNPQLMSEYIEKLNNENNLHSWIVCLVSKKKPKLYSKLSYFPKNQ